MRDLLKPVVTNCPMGCQLMVVNFTQSNCFSPINLKRLRSKIEDTKNETVRRSIINSFKVHSNIFDGSYTGKCLCMTSSISKIPVFLVQTIERIPG